jgi:DNA topoisomerase-1
MIICEKPDAAKKIAHALAEGKIQESGEGNAKYFVFRRNKEAHYAVPAVGHLFGLKDVAGKGWTYPVFDTEWAPVFELNKKTAYVRKYYENFQQLCKECKMYIVATDLDEEGSVIGYNILKFICNKNDAKRMQFSTLTKPDLVNAYENATPHLDFPRIESGLTRHELDFLWGVNTTRALTLAIKHTGKVLSHYLISAGRVQAPMLHFLMQREKLIEAFKPTPFWQIEVTIKTEPQITCMHEKDKFWEEKEAKGVLTKCKAKDAIVADVTKRQYKQSPPAPFDFTSLQTEAYRYFGYSPKQTGNIAQSLYTAGYISYPRTSSQKLPRQINFKEIITNLAKIKSYAKHRNNLLKTSLEPHEGNKSDPAHPAIHPTEEVPEPDKLNNQEKRLYDLIARRFLSCFGTAAIKESTKVIFDIAGERFPATGSRTIEKNWTEMYGSYAKSDEIIFPEIKRGDRFKTKSMEMLSKETQPPDRYSQGSIVKELEKHSIGTKTTRALILQTLYDRNYIDGKSIKVTKLGMQVGGTLAKYVPDLVSETLTRKFEKEMGRVETGKVKREKIISEAKTVLKKIAEEFKKNENKIGPVLEKSIMEMQEEQNTLGTCLKCGNKIKMMYSNKTKKRFVGCLGYPKCNNIYPLPGFGLIKKTEKICEQCKTPIVLVIRAGKRPFNMCLDPQCKTKENWGKPKEKKPEKEAKTPKE